VGDRRDVDPELIPRASAAGASFELAAYLGYIADALAVVPGGPVRADPSRGRCTTVARIRRSGRLGHRVRARDRTAWVRDRV
jgi:hypothetical protein